MLEIISHKIRITSKSNNNFLLLTLLILIIVAIPFWQVLKHMLYLMRFAEKGVQRCVALALAHLCSPNDRKTIFIENNGMEIYYTLFCCPLSLFGSTWKLFSINMLLYLQD